ncbi:MAG: TatD family hydrolase [Erysipelotrichaceae bacterium]|nr:TatD family hydrolase [Erysipelotrichaceae bacterium]
MLFDSHAHVNSDKFDNDREFVLNRAKGNGVGLIVNPGANLESSLAAIQLAETHAYIYAAVGVHPHDTSSMDPAMLDRLESLARRDKVVAIGEIGLDFHYDFSPREDQRKWFVEQLRLARRLKKPVIIHDREAHEEIFSALRAEQAFEYGVLMHCFSGSVELARQYVRLGAYISIAGPVTYKNNRKTVEVVEHVPLDRLLIETDSPYLTPEPHRGKRNEPMYVRHTCESIARIRGITFEEAAEVTLQNGLRFFGIPDPRGTK